MESRVKDAVQALAVGDWEGLRGFLADQFFGYTPGADEPGAADRFIVILSDLKAAMPDLEASIDDIASENGTYTATLTISGTHENELWGAPGSGAYVSWTNRVTIKPIGGAFALRFDDVVLPEMLGVLRQLGLVNPPDEMDQPTRYPVAIPEFLLKVVLTGQAGDKPCRHLDDVRFTDPTTDVCSACHEDGDVWPALRMCLICGYVGCCDTSKNKHMIEHYQETGHALMRSIRMDEGWVWCYEDNAFFEKHLLDRYRG